MMQLMLEWNVSVSSQDCSIFDGIGLAGQNLVLKKYWNRSFCLFVVRIVLICIDDEKGFGATCHIVIGQLSEEGRSCEPSLNQLGESNDHHRQLGSG